MRLKKPEMFKTKTNDENAEHANTNQQHTSIYIVEYY